MTDAPPTGANRIPTYCYQCVAGPDLLKVRVEDGVATEVQPNFDARDQAPSGGKVCVKAFGLIQKLYNPHRITTPMKRTNPRKGRDQDPGFVPIDWDEALDIIAGKIRQIHAEEPLDGSGYPRIAASFGGGGTPTYYMGTLPAFLGAIAPIDFGFGSGQGVKCYHSEHLYGEFWHRAFTVAPDTPECDYVLSFGFNVEASGGVCGVKRHADARDRGIRRVQIEPHLSITAACSAEWVPIRPKTDAAFLFALIHVLLHEQRQRLDLEFLKTRTGAPYLVAPNGFYLRDPETEKPLLFDLKRKRAVPFDTPDIDPALEGSFDLDGLEIGADDDRWLHRGARVTTAFGKLLDHMKPFTPLWAGRYCDVHHKIIRRIALEFLDHARVGETVEIEGRTLPYRPVAIVLGKTVNNGWGGYQCCWARTLMACLVGALEVPGGTLGTTVRLNRPATDRNLSVRPSPDGFIDYPMNPTDRDNWLAEPDVRNANRTLVPLVANSPWSQALGPTHLAWMQQQQGPEHWPQATPPDLWFVYRTNPAISFWDTNGIVDTIARFPFTVCFAYTRDETNHMADLLLPERTDLEGLQLIRIGGTKFIEQFWHYQGFALRQPVVEPEGDTRDFTWIATELARRCGVLEKYNRAINRGAAGVPLRGEHYDFSLATDRVHDVETIWDACCRAASAELTDGQEQQGLDYYREKGFRLSPFPRLKWYLTATMEDLGLRYELPYQERLFRIGTELGRRLHERGISWWDEQLEEYNPLPAMEDLPGIWEGALERNFHIDIDDYPFWLVTSRSMQYAWGGNVSIQLIREVAGNIRGHGGLVINAGKARELGLKDGDRVEIRSPLSATRGYVVTREGIRPDTLLLMGQFDHWATPLAKEFGMPSMNALTPMLLDLTDASGSGADLARVQITRLEETP
ncbi:MAG TPA: molybdopterin oxidoreductase [Sedimenticola thiotaurini]|uniref:Molybdopterin oxidoreductase n=1 Tax=Sedimenticola thiotaurini TaxID=1543721 RepID=A0A831RJ10_9GAMM|nr:molybdopterin oxidoreductase [Sedimenticola thiotaurini]